MLTISRAPYLATSNTGASRRLTMRSRRGTPTSSSSQDSHHKQRRQQHCVVCCERASDTRELAALVIFIVYILFCHYCIIHVAKPPGWPGRKACAHVWLVHASLLVEQSEHIANSRTTLPWHTPVLHQKRPSTRWWCCC